MTNIGARVETLRTERGLSLSEFARECGLSKSLLHRIENDATINPELGTLQKIARFCGITVGELLGNELVESVRQLPAERPGWLTRLAENLRKNGKEPDEDFLEALYVLQNRKGQSARTEDDWLYLYQTLERTFSR